MMILFWIFLLSLFTLQTLQLAGRKAAHVVGQLARFLNGSTLDYLALSFPQSNYLYIFRSISCLIPLRL